MKITKFGHCCLLIEENGVRALTDPGSYTDAQNDIKNIDVVVITHEHGDHFHVESVKKILERNPAATIVTNSSVSALLVKEGIVGAKIVEEGESFKYKELNFRAFGKEHAVIYKEWPIVQNTGYFIGDRLFYPGDAFTNPGEPVDILALPIAGPWLKIGEAIEYCLAVAPKKAIPMHDGGLNKNGHGFTERIAPQVFGKHNIEFLSLEIGKETEF